MRGIVLALGTRGTRTKGVVGSVNSYNLAKALNPPNDQQRLYTVQRSYKLVERGRIGMSQGVNYGRFIFKKTSESMA